MQAFAKGLDLDSCNPLLQEGAKAARDELSLEEVDKVGRLSLNYCGSTHTGLKAICRSQLYHIGCSASCCKLSDALNA